ncbi:DUF3558 domain-containing protein [Lentzea sp. HUAS12]|uniref:DUF3558 domain-containing protein n=1 Tax=Lentzea sp. HUAS12 TaxID=2951806 RepID=UPI00209D09BB|nr:DUF3558 domain-containing protein [Lentzea sp. HUAS12]USX50329.1 DUF3558 domain-containing protein [Lentzea sp. HUAS12]
MIIRLFKLATVVFVAAVLSACTTGGEKGNPTPASSSSTSSQSTSGSEVPARPSSLQLGSVDACKLLTPDQMKQIQAVATRPVELDLVRGAKSPSCHYRGEDSFTYTVGAVTHKGVAYWLGNPGNVNTKVISVADFGAVEIELKGGSGFDCSVAIDVADGQQLMVSYVPTSASEKDQSVLCGKAEKAADLALATLKTLK